MGDEEIEEKASGDSGSKTESPEPPPPPKIPDVELIVDGFGFMPKKKKRPKGRSSSRMSNIYDEHEEEMEEEDVCRSSTNIDIVRRYTWKTKNRMKVQVGVIIYYLLSAVSPAFK